MKKKRSYVFLKIKTVKKEKGRRGEKKRVVVSRMSSACCADRVSTRGEVEEKKKEGTGFGAYGRAESQGGEKGSHHNTCSTDNDGGQMLSPVFSGWAA